MYGKNWAIVSGDYFRSFEAPEITACIRNKGRPLLLDHWLLVFGKWLFYFELIGLVLPLAFIFEIWHVHCRRRR